MVLENFNPTRSQQKFFDYFPLQLDPPKPTDQRCIELHGEMCGKSTCAAIWLLLQSHWHPERAGLIFCKEPILSYFIETLILWEGKFETLVSLAPSVRWYPIDCDDNHLADTCGDRFDYIVIDQAGYLCAKDFNFIDRVLGDRGQILVTVGSEKSDDFLQWSARTKSLVIDINFGKNSWVTE